MSALALPTFALLALVAAGCDSRALVVGEGPSPTSLGGGARTNAQRCPDSAAARASDAECWPTRHVGRWRGFVTGDARYRHVLPEPFEFPSAEVSLEIEPPGTGTILFASAASWCSGDAGVSTPGGGADGGVSDAGGGACSSAPADTTRAHPGLVLDQRYALDDLSMSGSAEEQRKQDPAMTFSLLIAAPWRDYCSNVTTDEDAAPCRCDADGCTISSEALLVSLSLSRDGQALRGSIVSSSDLALVAGLELVRQ